MKLRDQAHEPHDVLGVSPASEPERIDAAYHSLIRKYGGRYGDLDRVRTIEAAYDQLKAAQRGYDHDAATASQNTAVEGPPMWQVRPRSKLPETATFPPGKHASPPASPATAPLALPPEPSFPHDKLPDDVGNRLDGPASRHWTISDWSSDQSLASASEPAEPTDQPNEDAVVGVELSRSRFAMPLAGGLGIITAALITQLLDRSPRPDKSEVRAAADFIVPTPVVPHQNHAARQPTIQSDDLQTQLTDAKQQPVAAPTAVEVAETTKDRRQAVPATATAIAQTEITYGTGLASANPAPNAQPVAPAPASAAPLIPAPVVPTLPTPTSKLARQTPPAALPTQPPTARQQAFMAMPARWISGGLHDSDNKFGRFVGAVAVRILVRPNGRAGGCRIAQSSGNPALDQTTCRLLGQRLLFSPAQDTAGRPIESEVGTTYVWGRRMRR